MASFPQAELAQPELTRLEMMSGVDLMRFTPRRLPLQEGQTAQPTRMVLTAHLLWDKGISEYVETARQLKAKDLPIRFLLAGAPDPGNPAAVPEATLDGWQMEGLIELLGQVSDMAGLPSYREGQPKSLIEAAACALSLVATDAPGCREVVINEVDGLTVPIKDACALAQDIESLYLNPGWAHQLGEAARPCAQGILRSAS